MIAKTHLDTHRATITTGRAATAVGSAAGLGKIWKFSCVTGVVFLHAIGAI
jgi:SNF family Na+-dependent transporter